MDIMLLAFVTQHAGIIDARDSFVVGCVPAVKVRVANARGHQLYNDFIWFKVTERDWFYGPFAL